MILPFLPSYASIFSPFSNPPPLLVLFPFGYFTFSSRAIMTKSREVPEMAKANEKVEFDFIIIIIFL